MGCSDIKILNDPQEHLAHDRQSNDSDGGGSEKGIDAQGTMDADVNHVDDIHMDPTISDGDTRGVEIDDCLDPLDLDNAVPLESAQDYPEINTGVFFDTLVVKLISKWSHVHHHQTWTYHMPIICPRVQMLRSFLIL